MQLLIGESEDSGVVFATRHHYPNVVRWSDFYEKVLSQHRQEVDRIISETNLTEMNEMLAGKGIEMCEYLVVHQLLLATADPNLTLVTQKTLYKGTQRTITPVGKNMYSRFDRVLREDDKRPGEWNLLGVL